MTSQPVVIIGAGRGQVGVAKAAKRLGYPVVAVTGPGDKLPVLEYADTVAHADISKPEQVLAALESITDPAAAVTSCLDTGIAALGAVCDEKGLVGLTRAAAQLCNDKIGMKQAFEAAGVRSSAFVVCPADGDAVALAADLTYPLVAKAPNLQGSKGIFVVSNPTELAAAIDEIRTLGSREEVLIEEFVDGIEVGAQAMVSDGNVLYVMPHADQLAPEQPTVPVGHSVPLEMSDAALADIRDQVEKAIGALGLNNCAVNVDLIVADSGAHMIELTGRVGANGLPEMVSEQFGNDYYETVVRLALGEDVTDRINEGAGPATTAVRMLRDANAYGTIASIEYDTSFPGEVLFFRGPGDRIDGFTSSVDCIGQAVYSSDEEDALAVVEALERSVNVVVEGAE